MALSKKKGKYEKLNTEMRQYNFLTWTLFSTDIKRGESNVSK